MVMTSQVYTSVKTDQITHFIMQFLVLKFYLNKVVKKKKERQILGAGNHTHRELALQASTSQNDRILV